MPLVKGSNEFTEQKLILALPVETTVAINIRAGIVCPRLAIVKIPGSRNRGFFEVHIQQNSSE